MLIWMGRTRSTGCEGFYACAKLTAGRRKFLRRACLSGRVPVPAGPDFGAQNSSGVSCLPRFAMSRSHAQRQWQLPTSSRLWLWGCGGRLCAGQGAPAADAKAGAGFLGRRGAQRGCDKHAAGGHWPGMRMEVRCSSFRGIAARGRPFLCGGVRGWEFFGRARAARQTAWWAGM